MTKNGNRYLLVIAGPTAVGKTSVAIALAKQYSTSIINADSRQIYTELNIGVAKPSPQELQEVKHHFVNHTSIHESFTASDYEHQCLSLLEQLYQTSNVVILSGGTGLYIQAVLEGFDEIPDVPSKIVNTLNEEYDSKGIEHLQLLLRQCDPDYYQRVDIHNHRRLIRAISVYRAHQKPYSSYLGNQLVSRNFEPILIQLDRPRELLYERINQRVDNMVADGLEAEVKSLEVFKDKQALQTVGYTEFFRHFDGELSKEEAIALIKQQSRRYAKRQLTWYRNKKSWHVLPADDLLKISECIASKITSA